MGGKNLDQFRSKQKDNQQAKSSDQTGTMPKRNTDNDDKKRS